MQKNINIISNEENQRIDFWLTKELKGFSRSYIQKLINDKYVLVNNNPVKANYKIRIGDRISAVLPKRKEEEIVPENIKLNIIYEDDSILVINKPKGMVVHPAAGSYTGTLVNALLYHYHGNLSDVGGVERPGIVHRLDKDTSGILVVAKNNKAHIALATAFKKHQVNRVYFALVRGVMNESSGKIAYPIRRHPVNRKKMAVDMVKGRKAVTYFCVLERLKNLTYVRLCLETGRTHQIRVHLAHIGHPIIGDPVYGRKNNFQGYDTKGQVLHAGLLGFNHPTTGKYMEFEAKLDDIFEILLRKFR